MTDHHADYDKLKSSYFDARVSRATFDRLGTFDYVSAEMHLQIITLRTDAERGTGINAMIAYDRRRQIHQGEAEGRSKQDVPPRGNHRQRLDPSSLPDQPADRGRDKLQ